MATDPTSLPLMGPESLTAEIVRIEGCLSLCGRELKPDPTDIATLERRRGLCTARLQAARRTARFVTRAAPSSSARPDHGNEHLAPALLTRWPEPGLSGPSIPLVFPHQHEHTFHSTEIDSCDVADSGVDSLAAIATPPGMRPHERQ
jgi:hypothetical protein